MKFETSSSKSMNRKAPLITVVVCSVIAFMIGRITLKPDADSSSWSNNYANIQRASSSSLLEARNNRRKSGLTESKMAIRMEAIINHPSRLESIEQWVRFVNQLGPDEFKEAVENFRMNNLSYLNPNINSKSYLKPVEYSMLLTAWAKVDPVAAIEYASENTDYNFAKLAVLSSWALNDPEAAMNWVELNCSQEERPDEWYVDPYISMNAVIRGMAVSDPERANELIKDNPGLIKVIRYLGDETNCLPILQGEYLKRGPDAAREWALSFSNEELRKKAVFGIATKLANTDPTGTFEWLQANPGKEATYAMSTVFNMMAKNNPATAQGFFDKIADNEAKSKALKGIAGALAHSDTKAAVDFIDLNSSVVTDEVIEEFLFCAHNRAPELVVKTIGRMQDEKNRENKYYRHINKWLDKDINAASNWFEQNQNLLSKYSRGMLARKINQLRNSPK